MSMESDSGDIFCSCESVLQVSPQPLSPIISSTAIHTNNYIQPTRYSLLR